MSLFIIYFLAVANMIHTRLSSSPSLKSKSDLPPKQKINKKSKATLNTKKAKPAIQSDQVSIDEGSPGSTSNIATPSKRKITQKSNVVVKDKRSKLAIHDDPVSLNVKTTLSVT